jgi:hypothetical protein
VKNTLTILGLLLTLFCTLPAKAQKAYDMILYQGTIYGNQAVLKLADGYLLASKLSMSSKLDKQEFSPSAGEPDARGDLRFDAAKATGRFKDNKGSWILIKKIGGAEYPSRIMAVYWDGKMQKTFVFNQR